jgi:hypothetical protein
MYGIYKNWDRVFYNYKFEALTSAGDSMNEQCMFAAGNGSNGKDTRICRMTALLGKSGEGGFAGTIGKQHFLGKETRDPEAWVLFSGNCVVSVIQPLSGLHALPGQPSWDSLGCRAGDPEGAGGHDQLQRCPPEDLDGKGLWCHFRADHQDQA